MKKITLLLMLVISVSSFGTIAQLSLPVGNIPNSENVNGVRASFLYGRTKNVSGVDFAFFSLSDMDNFSGLALDLFFGGNRIRNEFRGISLGFFNWHEGDDVGLNLGVINVVNDVNGINFGGLNYVNGTTTANVGVLNYSQDANFNLGFVNITDGNTYVDIGALNFSDSATFQLGIANATMNLDGVQIGLINYAKNGIFPVLPFINFKKSL